MSDSLNVSVVVDEPGRLIVIGEAKSVKLHNGALYADYHYYGQRNKGEWVDLAPHGNRIPSDW